MPVQSDSQAILERHLEPDRAWIPLLSAMLNSAKLFLSLAKPRITFMVTITSAVGFYLGGGGIESWGLFATTMAGTAISSGGACALNNYLERDIDKNMSRTSRRPLPSGRLSANQALLFGIMLVLSGTCLLAIQVNLLTGFLALLTAFLYVLVYTPLKRVTWLNTFVGAIPGALPPMGGWAASAGQLDTGAWILFLIMFLWQHPHFYAIAWLYKEDYRKAGFKMLPVLDPEGVVTFPQIILYTVLLVFVSILPSLFGLSGQWYLTGAILLGGLLLASGLQLAQTKSLQHAKALLHASLLYLPLLFLLIVMDS
ncbi:MAG: heme o synthase [Deltaproteobacteria bacterium]|nr:heme o synthase [Deltaproteobacteria bacterium]